MPCHVLAEVRADRHDASVDAWLDLAFEHRSAVPRRPWVVPRRLVADKADRVASLLARRVEAHVAQHQQGEQGDPLGIRLANVPQPILPPERQQPRAPALGRDAGTLGGDLVGRRIGQVAQRLPADRRVRIEQPVERVHQAGPHRFDGRTVGDGEVIRRRVTARIAGCCAAASPGPSLILRAVVPDQLTSISASRHDDATRRNDVIRAHVHEPGADHARSDHDPELRRSISRPRVRAAHIPARRGAGAHDLGRGPGVVRVSGRRVGIVALRFLVG